MYVYVCMYGYVLLASLCIIQPVTICRRRRRTGSLARLPACLEGSSVAVLKRKARQTQRRMWFAELTTP
jgi:hypothetical protein